MILHWAQACLGARPRIARIIRALTCLVLASACAPKVYYGDQLLEPTASSSTTGTSFTSSWPFTALTNALYSIGSNIDLTGGVARLTPSSQTDNTSALFASGSFSGGAAYDATNSYVRISTTSPILYLDSSWTPSWTNLVGYWKLDDANGAPSIVDSGPSGTYVGSPNHLAGGVAGKIGTSQAFDGASSYVDIGNQATMSFDRTSTFSLSAWVQTTSNTAGSIIGKMDPGSNYQGYDLYYCGAGGPGCTAGTIKAHLINTWPTDAMGIYVSGAGKTLINDGYWHFVTATYDGTGTAAGTKIYIDGTQQPTAIDSNTLASTTQNTVSFMIGARGDGSTNFDGQIDEAAVWNTTLSAQAVQTIYQHQNAKYTGTFVSRVMDAFSTGQTWTSLAWTPTLPFFKALPDTATSETSANYTSQTANLMSGIVALWHLDDSTTGSGGAGNDFKDNSGNTQWGTLNGGVTQNVSAVFGGGAKFNGTSGYISVTSSYPNFDTGGGFSAWIRPDNTGADTTFFGRTAANEIVLRDYDGSNYALEAVSYDSVGGCFRYYKSNTNLIPPNTWTHVVVSWNYQSVAAPTFYVNGVSQGNFLRGSFCAGPATSTVVAIGKAPAGAYGYFSGILDEIAVWSRTLLASEALELYRRGANRLRFQLRTCTDNTCTAGSPSWLGPDGTSQSYFTELYNTASNSLTGTVASGLPTMTFSNFGSLTTGTNRYFQYRAIFESDDANTLCNYGSGATACSPELKSVDIAPTHYDNTAPTIGNVSAISFSTLTSLTQVLGSNGCVGGIKYTLSKNNTNWYYWTGAAWAVSNNTYAQATSAATLTPSVLGQFATQVGTGNLYFKAYLNSSGSQACEIDQLTIAGTQ